MVRKFLLILFDFAIQGQIRMVIFLLIQFLREEWHYVYVCSFLYFNHKIIYFLALSWLYLDGNWLWWNQKLPNSAVYSCKSKLFNFECLNNVIVTFFNLSSQLMISLFSMSWSLFSFTYCQKASRIATRVSFFMPTILCKED